MKDQVQIKAKREAAARARRLSSELSQQADKDRILAVADELDAEADALDRKPPLDDHQTKTPRR